MIVLSALIKPLLGMNCSVPSYLVLPLMQPIYIMVQSHMYYKMYSYQIYNVVWVD